MGFRVPQEGFPAADMLASNGIRAFVLRYRLLPEHSLEDMLNDLSSAIEEVRRTHGGPVAAMGFSAGGHLVASLGVLGVRAQAGRARRLRLDAQVLVYPCI